MSNPQLTQEEKIYAGKMQIIFTTHWEKLHEQIKNTVLPKMNLPGATEQTFINLCFPIFRNAIKEWEQAADNLKFDIDGNKIVCARKSLMVDRIKETWGAEKGMIGEQIKRYL